MSKRKPKQPVAPPETVSQWANRCMIDAALMMEDAIGPVPAADRMRELAALIESGRTLF